MKILIVEIGSGDFDRHCVRLRQAPRLQSGPWYRCLRSPLPTKMASASGFPACSAVLRRFRSSPAGLLATANYFTSVGASGAVAASREITIGRFNPTVSVNFNVNLNTKFEAVLLNPSYVFGTPVLGGQLTLGMLALVGNNNTDLNGTLTLKPGPFSVTRQGSISQTTTGLGDLYPQAIIRWNSGANNWMVYGDGRHSCRRL